MNDESIGIATGIIGLLINFFVGYRQTGKLNFDVLLGIVTLFMDKYKAKLENQLHYNYVEPETVTTKKEIDIQEVSEPTKIIFSHPKQGHRVTLKFGNRTLKINGVETIYKHNGTDFGGFGQCVAIEDCIIEKIVIPDNEYPCVFKYTDKGWVTANVPKGRAWTPYISMIGLYTKNRYTFRHVKAIKELVVGQALQSGEAFCETGNLGYCQGAHLHIDIQELKDGVYKDFINPESFLESKGLKLTY
jgi:hypothetical protein